MAKDPAFLFYSDNFLSGTMFFTDEQVGKYMRLLCAQHQHGHLSEKHMLHICKTYDKDIWDKFTKDESGLFYQPRLETEVEKRKNFTESRRKNRLSPKKQTVKPKKKSNTSKTYDSSYENHMSTHMGNGNGNGNNNVIEIENEIKIILSQILLKLQLQADDSREFHDKVYKELTETYKLSCEYEYVVNEGRVDIAIHYKDSLIGIELDNRLPRSKSIVKLSSNFITYFMLVRNPKSEYNYSTFKNCLLYTNGFLLAEKTKTTFQQCIDIYDKFILDQTSTHAQIDGGEGKAMNSIIAALSKTEKVEDSSKSIPEVWEYILKHRDSWDAFHQTQLKIKQINSNLVNILTVLKNGNPRKQSTKNAGAAEIHAVAQAARNGNIVDFVGRYGSKSSSGVGKPGKPDNS